MKYLWNTAFHMTWTAHHDCNRQDTWSCTGVTLQGALSRADIVYDPWEVPSNLWYKPHLSRQYKYWLLRCTWSIACRRCSNCIFILDLKLGFNGLDKDNCRSRRETFKFGDLVRLISGVWRYYHSLLPLSISYESCHSFPLYAIYAMTACMIHTGRSPGLTWHRAERNDMIHVTWTWPCDILDFRCHTKLHHSMCETYLCVEYLHYNTQTSNNRVYLFDRIMI